MPFVFYQKLDVKGSFVIHSLLGGITLFVASPEEVALETPQFTLIVPYDNPVAVTMIAIGLMAIGSVLASSIITGLHGIRKRYRLLNLERERLNK